MEKQIVQIEGVTYDKLIEAISGFTRGKFVSVNDVPNIKLNQTQAAKFLGCCTQTVQKLMAEGELTNIGDGGHLRFGLQQLFLVWRTL